MKAIIPVAGLGTRMLPATKAIPKELLPVYDRPIIQHVVEEAIAAGITEIILVTRSGKEAIENHFDANYELEHRLEKKGNQVVLKQVKNIIPPHVRIASVRQEDALGLGHAILCAKPFIDENEAFAVLLPDVLVLDAEDKPLYSSFKQMVNRAIETGVGQVMVEQVVQEDVQNYGVVDVGGVIPSSGESTQIMGLVEKPSSKSAPSNLAVVGRYVLIPAVMQKLVRISAGVGGEIQLTDALDRLLENHRLDAFLTDANVHDCGTKYGFIRANVDVAVRFGMDGL